MELTLYGENNPLNKYTLHGYLKYALYVSKGDGDLTFRKMKCVGVIVLTLHKGSYKVLII